MTVFGDKALKKEVIKLNEAIRLAHIQSDWCPYKKRKFEYTDTKSSHAQRDSHVKSGKPTLWLRCCDGAYCTLKAAFRGTRVDGHTCGFLRGDHRKFSGRSSLAW